jgi:transcription antitermination protein NusB
MIRSRRRAREAVLQALYWSESSGDPIAQTLRTMCLRNRLSPEAAGFAGDLGKQVWSERDTLDQLIESGLQNWSLARLSRIDRLIMYMALAEILHMVDIPVKVSIDEAIELAKRYSVEKSPGFINGVLDGLVRREGWAARPKTA